PGPVPAADPVLPHGYDLRPGHIGARSQWRPDVGRRDQPAAERGDESGPDAAFRRRRNRTVDVRRLPGLVALSCLERQAMPALNSRAEDKAGKHHWDDAWSQTDLPPAIDPRARGLNHYLDRATHAWFRSVLGSTDWRGRRLLEIGCGNSVLLPYLAREFGFEPTGLDYSELGCKRARESLAREKIRGTIHCEDFFAPSAGL